MRAGDANGDTFSICLLSVPLTQKVSLFQIGVAVWLMDEFGYTVQQASFAFSCASIAFVTCSPISGFVADKIPKHRMKTMITGGLVSAAATTFATSSV